MYWLSQALRPDPQERKDLRPRAIPILKWLPFPPVSSTIKKSASITPFISSSPITGNSANEEARPFCVHSIHILFQPIVDLHI